ncbi:UDP-3-O-[3-hydroxymyristoyl] N-acetylglucosamine deacetylase [[Phormidium ambiguum] IAM M-71]|uniref:UDP-3-O-acyl-N-acetylglucosamine deacetylase n=1 Tax=[Phormidium ambiguum] IAM M-71 TaxID=454136 RepID=A0A1U7IKM3_9CYAN|nr:UDP-3-O-acyl-N-acetylglucosamine deacetylase [Phormidium ambiguum]OKH37701.1 UDP-3-O-[3-hydroxymyristoyl] N-acetylglucosamine deacetylase [Phormidium ambiguum IAM M-71]
MTQTLTNCFELSGVGLHNGTITKVRVLPALPGQGRYFVRIDLPEQPTIPAKLEAVTQTLLSTQLGENNGGVRTVEHLLAALTAMGVRDARIEIDGSEVPLLDGSARVWVEAILQAGLVEEGSRGAGEQGGRGAESYNSPNPQSAVPSPLSVYQGDAFVCAMPAPELRFTYGIDFDLPAIGNQWYSWCPSQESFADAIAPARTFGLAHQVEELRAKGLIKGGTLENALVCDRSGWLNPPLRFANEPVRHKILDLVGDLSLLGNIPIAHYFAYKASHNLHIQLAKLLQAQGLGTRD